MFFPPLDSTVVVDIPSNARAGGLSLLFRARTGSAAALEQLKRDGVKVQVWTNAPVGNDHTDGKWGAYNFEEAPVATPAKLDESIVPFPLPPPTGDNIVDEPHTLFLTLRLRALPQYQTETDFLVTYRLLYPNGEVKWLGYHGRDLRCVLKKTDPWLAPPAPASPSPGDVYRTFSSITMKEPWGCWAIGPRSVKYSPKGKATDCEAAFLVFVPKRGPSTFALHQPIILHGAGLKLDSSGVVTCRSSTPTRVYTAISSEVELSFAIPDLGLHWFGVKEGYALITSAAPDQPVSIHAVPLFVDPAATERPTTVSLDIASRGLLPEHQRFVAYSPLSNGVLDSDDWGSRQLHMSVGRAGGSCVVSPVYPLSIDKPSPHLGKAPWGIAYVTPHSTLGTKPQQDSESAEQQAAEASSRLEYDSETEFLSREIKPRMPPPLPSLTLRSVPTLCLNPLRTVEFLIPLVWRTLGFLVRALIMRLFAMIGLPASPFISFLRLPHPKGESIEAQARARVGGSKATSSEVPKVEYAASEVESDSSTEVASSVGGEKLRPIRVFGIPKGPFSILLHTELTMDMNGDSSEKQETRPSFPEVRLNGELMGLRITSLSHGWTIMRSEGEVNGGKVEIYGTVGSV